MGILRGEYFGLTPDAKQSRVDGLAAWARRVTALTVKESRQVVRDPSSIAIGVVLPVILILLFGYGLSLDVKNVPVALVMEDTSPDAMELAASFRLSPYFETKMVTSMHAGEELLQDQKVDGIVRIRPDFTRGVKLGSATVQVLVDAVDGNKARIIQGYAQGAMGQWYARQIAQGGDQSNGPVIVQDRLWFNEANDSHYYLVPGLIVLVMTLIGGLLTAMVMSREWERGTLEALFVTPVRTGEILLGKMIPYFVLGMVGLMLCLVSAKFLFGVPFRGSLWLLVGTSMLYLLVALATGLLISSAVKSQFVASQITLLVTFLPAVMLSGFLFDLRSMPAFIRWISLITLPGAVLRHAAPDDFSRGRRLERDRARRGDAGGHGGGHAGADARHDAQKAGLRTIMLDALFRILALTRKELLAVLKDPRGRFSLFLPPIIQCLIYGYAATYNLNDVPYAVLDQSRSAASCELLGRLDGSRIFNRVETLEQAGQIKACIDQRRALVVIQIGQDFERELLSGRPADIQVIADGRNSNTAGTATGYVAQVVDNFNAQGARTMACLDPPIQVTWARLVQPQPKHPLAHDPQPHRHAHPAANHAFNGHVGGARKRAGHVRSTSGHALSPRGDHGGQVAALYPGGVGAGHQCPAGGPVLVSHSLRGFIGDVVRGAEPVPAGGRGHWAVHLGAGGEHAAGDALFVPGDDALLAALGVDHAGKQHAGIAGRAATLMIKSGAALRDRHRPAGIPGRRRAGPPDAGPVAHGDHRGGDAIDAAAWMFRHRLT